MNKTKIILLLILVVVVNGQYCNSNGVCTTVRNYCIQPNDCGTLPYGNCSQATSCVVSPGIALGSPESGLLYYIEHCSVAGGLSYKNINSVYVTGGSPTFVASLNMYITNQIILGFWNNNIFFIPATTIDIILSYDIIARQINQWFFPAVESIFSLTYVGNTYYLTTSFNDQVYEVDRANYIEGNVYENAPIVNNLNVGSNVSVIVTAGPNNTIFYNNNGTIYNLDLTTNIKTPVYYITEFNAYMYINGNLLFATDHGLFKYSISQKSVQLLRQVMQKEGPYIGIAADNNRIYYSTASSVRSIDYEGGNDYLVNQKNEGICVCRPNFTGGDCKTCKGQIQWGNDGYPNCVALDENGIPVTCSQDYQCGNVPYSICSNNTCACRPNFTGVKCETCGNGTITWSQSGIPSCNQ